MKKKSTFITAFWGLAIITCYTQTIQAMYKLLSKVKVYPANFRITAITLFYFLPGKPTIKAQRCFILFLFAVFIFFDSTAQPTLEFNKIIQGLSSPLGIKNAGDGTKRLFIVEQPGTIRIYKNGNLLTKPFLNVSSLVRYTGGEQGLFSIAFPPNYKTTRYFFIYYAATNGNVTLARYRTSKSNPDVANLNSGVILFSYPKPGGFPIHNGGTLNFGKDGYLYVSIGDGGSQGDPFNNAQNGRSHFGKMLRLNVSLVNAPYYSIPPDNPFVNDPDVLDDIYELGLRNPWRWSFDRLTGDIWIGDVGQDTREEIDFRTPSQAAGANYGWRCYEGNIAYKTDSCKSISNYLFPVFDYEHHVSNGGICVTGGYVYRGSAFPQLQGYYICCDYVSANSWKIKPNGLGGWNVYLQKNIPSHIESFGEDEDGELYASALSGEIYRVTAITAIAQSSSDIYALTTDATALAFPSFVDNSLIILKLNDDYNSVRLIDMSGHEVMKQNITGKTGKLTLYLPKLSAGIYIIQLIGRKTEQQKIYITK